jgi:glutamate synthase (NADPH/NADH) small chain
MPARIEEIHHAEQEGVIFKLLTNPVRFIGDDKGILKEVECIKMELGEPDDSGRRRPIPIKGSEFKIKIDTALVAIGQSPNPLIPQSVKGLKIGKWGNIETDEEGRTNIPYIFAGGDIATGAATVILAMGAGKRAARAIDEYLKKK